MKKRESLREDISQIPSVPIPGNGEPSLLGLTPQEKQLRSWFRVSSILLGFLPLLLLLSAYLLVIHEGRCQPHPGSNSLAQLSLIFFGMEMLAGLLCLFYKRIRPLASTLLLTLMLSVLPGFLIVYLSFLAAFCLHTIF